MFQLLLDYILYLSLCIFCVYFLGYLFVAVKKGTRWNYVLSGVVLNDNKGVLSF